MSFSNKFFDKIGFSNITQKQLELEPSCKDKILYTLSQLFQFAKREGSSKKIDGFIANYISNSKCNVQSLRLSQG